MKKGTLILIGAAIGCLVTLLVTSIQRQNEEENIEAAMGLVKGLYDMANPEPTIQYIEVTGKNGPATLHNYMAKDSVQILLGKPDEADMHTLPMGIVREEWEYRTQDGRWIRIEFENGMLINVNQ